MKYAALFALFAAVAATVPAHGKPAEPGRLELAVEVGAQTGAVMVSLFDSASAYSGGAAVRHARIDVAAGERTAVFADLPAGAYAVRAFHDEDGDGRMNANPFGVLTEPFAFSNNARANMGPASWDSARFTVAGATAHAIILR